MKIIPRFGFVLLVNASFATVLVSCATAGTGEAVWSEPAAQEQEIVFVPAPVAMNSYVPAPRTYANQGVYRGQLSSNPYIQNSTSNSYGQYGSSYSRDSINNPYGRYGSRYSNQSPSNPYATDAPRLYDSQGHYHGRLSNNSYDPDSTSNPYGKYGSKYSSESINNPCGAGNPYSNDSPNNPYGSGMQLRTDAQSDGH